MSPALVLGVYAALAVVMALAWWWQKRVANIGWVDVFWTFGVVGAGLILALVGADQQDGLPLRLLLVCTLLILWGLRLGLYVAFRIARSPEDGRYVHIRRSWGERLQPRLFWFLQLQALVSTVLAVAIGLAANRPDPDLDLVDAVGLGIALLAIGGEALADRQLETFKASPANHGKVCDIGLWAWSRHPNYLFEWLGWFTYPVMAISLSGAYPQGWIAFLAPLVMFGVLRFGTGVPPLEEHMARTRGDAFEAYRSRVPVFFPRPPR